MWTASHTLPSLRAFVLTAVLLAVSLSACSPKLSDSTAAYLKLMRQREQNQLVFTNWREFNEYTEALILLAVDGNSGTREKFLVYLKDLYKNLGPDGDVSVAGMTPKKDAAFFADVKAILLQKIYDPRSAEMTSGIYFHELEPQMDLFMKLRPPTGSDQPDAWFGAAKSMGLLQ